MGINVTIGQLTECLTGMQENPSAIPSQDEFFSLKFLEGNETNGKEQQLEHFLGLWPMAADKNLLIAIFGPKLFQAWQHRERVFHPFHLYLANSKGRFS